MRRIPCTFQANFSTNRVAGAAGLQRSACSSATATSSSCPADFHIKTTCSSTTFFRFAHFQDCSWLNLYWSLYWYLSNFKIAVLCSVASSQSDKGGCSSEAAARSFWGLVSTEHPKLKSSGHLQDEHETGQLSSCRFSFSRWLCHSFLTELVPEVAYLRKDGRRQRTPGMRSLLHTAMTFWQHFCSRSTLCDSIATIHY